MATRVDDSGCGPCETKGCEVVIRGTQDGWPDTSGRLACRRCWDYWTKHGRWPDDEVDDA